MSTSTSPNLPAGAFITTLNGRRCTAVPRTQATSSVASVVQTTSVATSTVVQDTTTTSTSVAVATSLPLIAPVIETSTAQETTTSTTSSTSTSILQTSQAPAIQTSSTTAPLVLVSTTSTLSTSTTSTFTTSTTSLSTTSITTPLATATFASSSTPIDTSPQDSVPAAAISAALPFVPIQSDSPIEVSQTDTNTAPASSANTVPPSAPELTTATSTNDAAPSGLTTTAQASPAKPTADTTTNNPAVISSLTNSGASTVSTSSAFGSSGSETTTDPTALAATNGASPHKMVMIAGGVVGGLVLVALIALLLWFCRKRLMKKRRSTMLTPLGPEPGFRIDEKGPYTISRDSIGPTPVAVKFKNALGNSIRSIRGRIGNAVLRSPAPSVNMDRGNSQFIDLQSSASGGVGGGGMLSTKDRFKNWMGRVNEDASFNWRLRNNYTRRPGSNDPFLVARGMTENNKASLGSSPDFLTLLSMDDQQLAAQTNQNRTSRRRSTSLESNDHFLGGLGLNFGSTSSTNPFSDANAMSHDSAKVQPLKVPAESNNPFSDANVAAAAKGPNTYVDNIRQSRGQPTSNGHPPSSQPGHDRGESVYRESAVSVDSFSTRRNKFRSDPFDLDRPELLSSSSTLGSSVGSSGVVPLPLPSPQRAHARQESFSSKYSSGVASLIEWSDPGPDVGPATTRWDNGKYSPQVRRSGASYGSVGKAL